MNFIQKHIRNFINHGIRPADDYRIRIRIRTINFISGIALFITAPTIGLYHAIINNQVIPFIWLNLFLVISLVLNRKRYINAAVLIITGGIVLGNSLSILTGKSTGALLYALLATGVMSYFLMINRWLKLMVIVIPFTAFFLLNYYQKQLINPTASPELPILFVLFVLIGALHFFTLENNNYRKALAQSNHQLHEQNEELQAQNQIIAQQKEELKALDESKTQFFNNISHEFRTPLTLIQGALQQLEENPTGNLTPTLISNAHQSSGQLKELIDQLLDIAKVEHQQHIPTLAPAEVIAFLRTTVMMFESAAVQKNISLNFESDVEQYSLMFDREGLTKIMNNLLSNALKFTPEYGRISVQVFTANEWLKVTVTDTGMGIPKEELPQIFDRFHQAKHHLGGTGIGLALVKELLTLYQGEITVTSEEGKGTTFTFQLPQIQDEASDHHHPIATQESPTTPVETTSSKAQLLIVEDNTDLQTLLAAYLSDVYEIAFAANGEDGIQQALESIPDLIISDVMMPKKNGFELCTTLKNHDQTAHIPIILLTARTGQANTNEGLKAQADDYLTKPFDKTELLLRIQNLLKVRNLLREKYANSTKFIPEEISSNTRDQAFMQQALEILELHYQRQDFSVQELAEALNLSQRQLNRKMQALVSQTSVQFIQSFRLEKTKQLLADFSLSMGDIAFAVGFNSASYFNKAFKKMYGKTPTAFQKSLVKSK